MTIDSLINADDWLWHHQLIDILCLIFLNINNI